MKKTLTDDFDYVCDELRVLPLAGTSNLLVGRRGYEREIAWRRERIAAGVPYDLPAWDALEIYAPKP